MQLNVYLSLLWAVCKTIHGFHYDAERYNCPSVCLVHCTVGERNSSIKFQLSSSFASYLEFSCTQLFPTKQKVVGCDREWFVYFCPALFGLPAKLFILCLSLFVICAGICSQSTELFVTEISRSHSSSDYGCCEWRRVCVCDVVVISCWLHLES